MSFSKMTDMLLSEAMFTKDDHKELAEFPVQKSLKFLQFETLVTAKTCFISIRAKNV